MLKFIARKSVTHRTFKDSQGRIWDVWQVHPSAAERRFVQRRVHDEDRTDAAERRSGLERRQGERKVERPAAVAKEFTYGWLCFETVGEKRRLRSLPQPSRVRLDRRSGIVRDDTLLLVDVAGGRTAA